MSIVKKGADKKMLEKMRNQRLSYADYMKLALYDEQYGYYMQQKEKIGRAGDFITTSNVGHIIGHVFANVFIRLIETYHVPPFICEIGGGTGRFAYAVLEQWKRQSPDTFEKGKYTIVETSPYHRKKQAETLASLIDHVHIVSSFAELSTPFCGIVFSNELFDAFPVHVIEKRNGQLYECFVAVEEDRLVEQSVPLENEEIVEYIVERNIQLVDGQRFEIPLAMKNFIFELDQAIDEAIIFTVDYGYTDEEWKHPARKQGSLRGYYRHQLIDDPLRYPGEMDLTTHIQWDALRFYGEQAGWTFTHLWRQDEFLLQAGILNQLIEHHDPNPFSEQSRHNRAIRSLVMSDIGKAFQVMVQQKKINVPIFT
ncbi:SAM-dependent methyltransferase [Anoxybacillus salavatliensis]|uniref:class I SAM-dependent methyltransferase n=1 Tax=Anoxybacillus gonensis TaxID=198467 RepID=UPI00214AA1C2|nr:SAM-dependent methyltransferase [Anoxybacillus gonensis]MCQ5364173.1 SAM-dependent methyltransferase [Anoxybacillus gonensis]